MQHAKYCRGGPLDGEWWGLTDGTVGFYVVCLTDAYWPHYTGPIPRGGKIVGYYLLTTGGGQAWLQWHNRGTLPGSVPRVQAPWRDATMSAPVTIQRAPRGRWPRKGEWVPRVGVTGAHSAAMCCPQCGLLGGLDDHRIAHDGAVSPSVQCPTPGCGFHSAVQLANYAGTAS